MFKKENHFPVSSDSEVVNSTVCHTICQSANNLHKSSLKHQSLKLDVVRVSPHKQEQAVTQENPHTVHELILSNIRLIQGRSSVLGRCQSTPQKNSATDRSRVKTTLTEPTHYSHLKQRLFFCHCLKHQEQPKFFRVTDLLDLVSSRAAESSGENPCTASLSFTRLVFWI